MRAILFLFVFSKFKGLATTVIDCTHLPFDDRFTFEHSLLTHWRLMQCPNSLSENPQDPNVDDLDVNWVRTTTATSLGPIKQHFTLTSSAARGLDSHERLLCKS